MDAHEAKPCSFDSLDDNMEAYEFANLQSQGNIYCPTHLEEDGAYQLKNHIEANSSQYIMFAIEPCKNNSANGNHCHPHEDIEHFL